jgi:uncharacterized protein YggE
MSVFKFLLPLILSPALSLAQLTNDTVTATASQTTSTAPDQATFSITVSSGANATLEQIVNALSGVGVTAANLNSVFGLTNNVQRTWNLQLTVLLTQLETTSAALTALEKSIPQNNSGLSLSFYVSSTQFSGQASANCNFSTLLAQARTQAQQIAGAAGLQTGGVTALNTATAGCSLTVTFAIPTLFAQPGPNTITISASGATVPQNDQATLYLNVASPLTADLSDVTNALSASGVMGANFSGVDTEMNYDIGGNVTILSWSFTLTAPLSKLTATIAQIASAEQAVTNQDMGLTLTLLSAYASASQSQQTSACSQSTLVTSALALAQQIASAAGVSVGPVLNISQGGSTGAFASVVNAFYVEPVITNTLSTPCALTFQYQLL